MRKIPLILALLLCPLAHATVVACITTPGTYNLSSGASWVGGVAPNIAGGDRITCATSGVKIIADVNYIIGDSPASGTKVINFTNGSTFGLALNVMVTAKGDAGIAILQRAAGSHLFFTSTGAGSPTSTPYTLTVTTMTDDATNPPTWTVGGSYNPVTYSGGNFFLIDADPAGTNMRLAVTTAGAGITGFINTVVNYCGDSSVKCLPYTGGGSGVVQIGCTSTTIASCTAPVIFDHTAGIAWVVALGANDGYNLRMTFKNTCAGCIPFLFSTAGAPAGGVPRNATNMVIDGRATLESSGSTWTDPLFLNGWVQGVFPNTVQGQMNRGWIVHRQANDTDGGQDLGEWNINGTFIVEDDLTTYSAGTVQPPTPFKTGTLTAASVGSVGGAPASILTDSGASFPSTMIDSGTGGLGWCVAITSGAAAGTVGNIQAITGTTIMNTARPLWIAAVAGETYATYNGLQNPHYTVLTPQSAITTASYEHMIGGFIGCDGQGDFFHSANNPITYNFDYPIIPTNLARGNVGTLATLGSPSSGTIAYNITHATYFTGEQPASICEGCTSVAGKVAVFQSNLGFQDPAVNYKYLLTQGPYAIGVSQGSPSSETADEIAINCFGGSSSCADFNGWYGMYPSSASPGTGGYCSTVVVGCGPVYNVNSTKIMGAHDLLGVDPGFPNRWANAVTWGYSIGAPNSGDPFHDWAYILNQIASVNDPTGHNAAYSQLAFYNYMQAQFTPTVSAYLTGGAGGTYIGAVPPQIPAGTNARWSGLGVASGSILIQ